MGDYTNIMRSQVAIKAEADRDIQRVAEPYANYLTDQFKYHGTMDGLDEIEHANEMGLASLMKGEVRKAIVASLSDGYVSAEEIQIIRAEAGQNDALTEATLDHLSNHQPIFARMDYLQHLLRSDCTLPSHKTLTACTSTDDIEAFRQEVREKLRPTLAAISQMDPSEKIRHKAADFMNRWETPQMSAEPIVVMYGKR